MKSGGFKWLQYHMGIAALPEGFLAHQKHGQELLEEGTSRAPHSTACSSLPRWHEPNSTSCHLTDKGKAAGVTNKSQCTS